MGWWTGLDATRRALAAALTLLALGVAIGLSPVGGVPGRLHALEASDARQDRLLEELAEATRFGTCLGLAHLRDYDPEVCELLLPFPERFIPGRRP